MAEKKLNLNVFEAFFYLILIHTKNVDIVFFIN